MKLIIVAAVLLIVTITAFSVFLSAQLSSTADTMFQTYLADISKMQAMSIDECASDTEARFDVITALPGIKKFASGGSDSKAAEEELNALIDSGALSSAVIYKDNGDVVLACGANSSVTSADGICNTDAEDGKAVIFAAEGSKSYAVSVKGKVGSLNVGLVFSNSGVTTVVSQAKGLVFVVDPLGNVATTNQTFGGNYNGEIMSQFSPYKDLVASAVNEPSKYVSSDGTMLAYAASSASGWKAVAYQEAVKAKAYANDASSTVTGIAIAMLVICLVAAINHILLRVP